MGKSESVLHTVESLLSLTREFSPSLTLLVDEVDDGAIGANIGDITLGALIQSLACAPLRIGESMPQNASGIRDFIEQRLNSCIRYPQQLIPALIAAGYSPSEIGDITYFGYGTGQYENHIILKTIRDDAARRNIHEVSKLAIAQPSYSSDRLHIGRDRAFSEVDKFVTEQVARRMKEENIGHKLGALQAAALTRPRLKALEQNPMLNLRQEIELAYRTDILHSMNRSEADILYRVLNSRINKEGESFTIQKYTHKLLTGRDVIFFYVNGMLFSGFVYTPGDPGSEYCYFRGEDEQRRYRFHKGFVGQQLDPHVIQYISYLVA